MWLQKIACLTNMRMHQEAFMSNRHLFVRPQTFCSSEPAARSPRARQTQDNFQARIIYVVRGLISVYISYICCGT
jgi:hypothetical protein